MKGLEEAGLEEATLYWLMPNFIYLIVSYEDHKIDIASE